MGEQPLFACKAHVFQLEPEMKKSWLPLSTTSVNVQFFHDPIKNIYRIVSVEGTKALINSIVTAKMTFTKTSQKFGQWIDFKMNVVYGLGFSNDVELNKFVEKFKEIKELTRNLQKSQHPHERSNSVEIAQINRPETIVNNNNESVETQLKYENDRLKLALAQSSSNARKWEEELQILKNNNARLTTALQESHSNVDEWKKQLQFYKEECARLRSLTNNNNNNNNIGNSNNNLTNNSDEMFNQINGNSHDTLTKKSGANVAAAIASNNKRLNDSVLLKQELNKLANLFELKLTELNDVKDQFKKFFTETD